jgi:hypothetical protein
MAVDKKKTVVLQVSFPRIKHDDLKAHARNEGYSVSSYIKKIMLDLLKEAQND